MRNRTNLYLPLGLLGLALLVALPVSAQQVSLGSNHSVALDLAFLTKAACHGTVSCQPEYAACASWSGYFDCDDPYCGVSRDCSEPICDEWGRCFWPPAPALRQKTERYRVCFNQYGQSCTEWEAGGSYVLDCGC